jgi:CheY-like chemotaxis protein
MSHAHGTDVILLVEDDPNDVLLMRRACAKSNLTNPLQVVNDGDAAVAYLSGQPPYADRQQFPLPLLILLDLKLPRRSGLEVLAWVRQQPNLRRLPVVVLTSSREKTDVNRAYDLGANSYLVKPVTFTSLMDIVQTLNMFWCILSERPSLEDLA